MAITHYGALTVDSANDIVDTVNQFSSAALTASGTFPQGALTGGAVVGFLNTTATPGTVTTRTAQQMYADMTAELGFAPSPGFDYFLRIVHTGAGTLTLAAGTGVTFGTAGTYTVATTNYRDFIVTVTNAGAITIQTIGYGTWS
jgi:hypothetical protein